MNHTNTHIAHDAELNEEEQTEIQTEGTSIISNAILFMLSMLVINEILLNFIAKRRNRYPKLFAYFNETIITTLLGVLAGTFLIVVNDSLILKEYRAGFSQFFLIVLLPPILFEGYHYNTQTLFYLVQSIWKRQKKKILLYEKALFFKYFGSILCFAIFGTLIATTVTSMIVWLSGLIGMATSLSIGSSFAFGALISATDPVAVLGLFQKLNADKMLYILIFGESILNDAISIIIYETCVKVEIEGKMGFGMALLWFLLLFVCSILIGFIIGIICAYLLKYKSEMTVEQQETIEASVTIIMPWVSYLIAEGLDMSGIVSIIFCGISMARYALPNLSDNGMKLLNRFYHIVAYNFENLVFLFIGIGMVGFDLAWKEMGPVLFIVSLLTIVLARYLNIKGVTFVLNSYRHRDFIKPNHSQVMWFSGLRGAMAYALALNSAVIFVDDGEIILTLTILIVAFNIFIQGALLMPVMQKYDVRPSQQEVPDEETSRRKGCIHKFKDMIEKCDQRILQRYLIKQLIRPFSILLLEIMVVIKRRIKRSRLIIIMISVINQKQLMIMIGRRKDHWNLQMRNITSILGMMSNKTKRRQQLRRKRANKVDELSVLIEYFQLELLIMILPFGYSQLENDIELGPMPQQQADEQREQKSNLAELPSFYITRPSQFFSTSFLQTQYTSCSSLSPYLIGEFQLIELVLIIIGLVEGIWTGNYYFMQFLFSKYQQKYSISLQHTCTKDVQFLSLISTISMLLPSICYCSSNFKHNINLMACVAILWALLASFNSIIPVGHLLDFDIAEEKKCWSNSKIMILASQTLVHQIAQIAVCILQGIYIMYLRLETQRILAKGTINKIQLGLTVININLPIIYD